MKKIIVPILICSLFLCGCNSTTPVETTPSMIETTVSSPADVARQEMIDQGVTPNVVPTLDTPAPLDTWTEIQMINIESNRMETCFIKISAIPNEEIQSFVDSYNIGAEEIGYLGLSEIYQGLSYRGFTYQIYYPSNWTGETITLEDLSFSITGMDGGPVNQNELIGKVYTGNYLNLVANTDITPGSYSPEYYAIYIMEDSDYINYQLKIFNFGEPDDISKSFYFTLM